MTKLFEEKKFNIPKLKGVSEKALEEHLKLYLGYVKNTNTILAKIDEYTKDAESNAYALGELQRRFGFEFNGVRNHDGIGCIGPFLYFESKVIETLTLSPTFVSDALRTWPCKYK